MNNVQIIITIAILAFSVAVTRFLPFVFFRNRSNLPRVIDYLGKVLPAAMMGLLVVYCFKDCDFTSAKSVLPFVIAASAVAGLHLWKRNTVLSIACGTALYMILIRLPLFV